MLHMYVCVLTYLSVMSIYSLLHSFAPWNITRTCAHIVLRSIRQEVHYSKANIVSYTFLFPVIVLTAAEIQLITLIITLIQLGKTEREKLGEVKVLERTFQYLDGVYRKDGDRLSTKACSARQVAMILN